MKDPARTVGPSGGESIARASQNNALIEVLANLQDQDTKRERDPDNIHASWNKGSFGQGVRGVGLGAGGVKPAASVGNQMGKISQQEAAAAML